SQNWSKWEQTWEKRNKRGKIARALRSKRKGMSERVECCLIKCWYGSI
ncbi:hypothetical protein HMPREF3216_00349, partial [Gardnerella vaginalis]